MRFAPLAATTLAALALLAQPAAAQVSARILLDIPILGGNRGPTVVHRAPPPSRVIVVHDYNSRRHGNWKKDARDWRPVTLYLYGGRYYASPLRGGRQVTVYNYRNQYFQAPRDRGWDQYRNRYERDDWRRWDDRRDDRWDDRRDDRWDDRRDDRRDGRQEDRRDDRRNDRYNGRARQ